MNTNPLPRWLVIVRGVMSTAGSGMLAYAVQAVSAGLLTRREAVWVYVAAAMLISLASWFDTAWARRSS